MAQSSVIREALARGEGILPLAPAWVPRAFLVPGGRLRLHPDDLYALGAHRGGIDERWLASTTRADNGPGTPDDEGLSYFEAGGQRVLLREAMDVLGGELLSGGHWDVLCKLFDNQSAIPLHMHQREEHARLVGCQPKPEAYFFPPQYNATQNDFPYTFFGLEPGTTRDDIRRCLEKWDAGDNGILYHSRAYKLQPGSAWQINAGILHAPGSLVTYEPQVNSDVFSMWQSMNDRRPVPWDFLVRNVPPEYRHDLDFIIGMLDWEANVDPEFARRNRIAPRAIDAMEGCTERWIVHSTPYYSAKELVIAPKRVARVKDAAAYGMLAVQGRGSIGRHEIETPSMIRYGETTKDEFFVTAAAARAGIAITNASATEPLVLLKHFAPGNAEAPKAIQ